MDSVSEPEKLKLALKAQADPQKAADLQRFFKTGPDQYGEGDQFWGIRVPMVRKVAKKFKSAEPETVLTLIADPIHEVRQSALFIWVDQFKRASEQERQVIYTSYLQNADHINNWDLVDASAPHIVGAYLYNKSRSMLHELAQSTHLWRRRIAVMATFYFIKQNDFEDAIRLYNRLLNDDHDLIHKAVGWMLREIGNRNRERAEAFLKTRYDRMPRTMLRYAIEKFPEELRQAYLKGRIAV